MINGTQEGERNRILEETRRCHPKAVIFQCKQAIRSLVPFPMWSRNSGNQSIRIKSAYLVAAVGNPGRLVRDIQELGIEIRGTKFFPDHYWLQPKDWMFCIEDARSRNAEAILLTEKDAIKIPNPPDFPLMVAVQSTEITDASGFELILKRCVEERA